MIKAVIPALLLVTTAIGPASADSFISGKDMDRSCRRDNNSFAIGYAVGIADVLLVTHAETICIPANSDSGQIVEVVCKYVVENPKERHRNARVLVVNALREAFPCKK